ncbi:YdeI/OmpD-associated family protein [Parvularcula marina]|uniref:YdhG-like domain-containing protein n=1 Tax=Parvularcula marina TaxID=2292771 RepID=A0A371RHV9_9PROT|nr:YdeI/OmpD-associated family protein [Parvularcula marina]RFB05025.1 hypothetical protein DX908_06805 [Parvularcula marina]
MNSGLDAAFNEATQWREEALLLRKILLEGDVREEKKWGKPCYTHDGRNIVIIQRFKDFLALLFFKGALLKDPDGLLEPQGPNSREGYRMCFRCVDEVTAAKDSIRSYLKEAIKIADAGLKVEEPGAPDLPSELIDAFDDDPDLRAAFEALTPGRQRGYCLYFSDAKQSSTRASRIEKSRDKIFAGKGIHDR